MKGLGATSLEVSPSARKCVYAYKGHFDFCWRPCNCTGQTNNSIVGPVASVQHGSRFHVGAAEILAVETFVYVFKQFDTFAQRFQPFLAKVRSISSGRKVFPRPRISQPLGEPLRTFLFGLGGFVILCRATSPGASSYPLGFQYPQ